VRLGIAHHLGWAVAVAVTASADHTVVDRRRIELIEPGMRPHQSTTKASRSTTTPPQCW
jgi:hypothetical protein